MHQRYRHALCGLPKTQEDHRRHKFINLEAFYVNKMALCVEEISEVEKYFLPTSHDLQKEIKGDTTEIKMIMDGIRTAMKADVTEIKMIMDSIRTAMKADEESFKRLVDTVVSENMQQVDSIEQSLLENLQSQDTTFDDYISYLDGLLKQLYGYLYSPKLSNIIPKLLKKIPITRPVPETPRFR
jgi:hypothetical protein